MAVQVHRLAACVFTRHGAGERGEIGDVPTPIIDPYEIRVRHVVRGMAVAAMFEHAYGITGKQEIPDHLAVFASEFGESVRDHDRAAEHRGGAVLAKRVESVGVVAVVMQLSGTLQLRQRVAVPIDGGGIHPAFRHAGFQRGEHRMRHFGVVVRLVDERDGHAHHDRHTKVVFLRH